MTDFKYGDITQKITGASFRAHSAVGNGFQEVIYQRAPELEFKIMPLNYSGEFEMPIYYLDQQIGARRVDFLVEDKDVHLAQAINYLEAYSLEIGSLINFGSKRLEFHRFMNKKYNPNIIQHPLKSQSSH